MLNVKIKEKRKIKIKNRKYAEQENKIFKKLHRDIKNLKIEKSVNQSIIKF